MKVITQTADELVLRDGNKTGIIVGGLLAVLGVLAGIFLNGEVPYMIWIALATVLVGVAVVLFSSAITVSASKKSGQLIHETKRIVGGKTVSYGIGDVMRIETRKMWRMDSRSAGNNRTVREPKLVAQSYIVFKNGVELALDHEKTSSSMRVGGIGFTGGQGNESAQAAMVAQFLGVPFQDVMPPNMGSGINISF
jgi:hypothetical protein